MRVQVKQGPGEAGLRKAPKRHSEGGRETTTAHGERQAWGCRRGPPPALWEDSARALGTALPS